MRTGRRIIESWAGAAVGLAGLASVVAGAVAAQTDAPPQEDPPAILGAPAAFGPVAREEETLLAAGTELRQSPGLRAPVSDIVDAPVTVAIAERLGAWARIRWTDRVGWLVLDDVDELDPGLAPLDHLPEELQPTPVDPDRLAAALDHLGPHRGVDVAGYRLLTDLASRVVERRLVTLLGRLDATVAERFGVAPIPAGREAIVVYTNSRAFRAFVEQDDSDRRGSSHLGQAHGGLAVLTTEDLTTLQTEAVFVHEVAHLAIRRAFGLRLPPWLEEGMAEDIAYHRRDEDGRLVPDSWSQHTPRRLASGTSAGGTTVFSSRELSGAGARQTLVSAFGRGRSPHLEALVAMDDEAFYSGQHELRYPRSALFVRFLLAEHAAGFGSFLRAVSKGDEAGGDRLLAHLDAGLDATLDGDSLDGDDVGWHHLDMAFAAWLRQTGAGS